MINYFSISTRNFPSKSLLSISCSNRSPKLKRRKRWEELSEDMVSLAESRYSPCWICHGELKCVCRCVPWSSSQTVRDAEYRLHGWHGSSLIFSFSMNLPIISIWSWFLSINSLSSFILRSIDALAEAINCYSGGMILVSHDFRLVSQVLLFWP